MNEPEPDQDARRIIAAGWIDEPCLWDDDFPCCAPPRQVETVNLPCDAA